MNNPSAFPRFEKTDNYTSLCPTDGMSLRDYVAAHQLQGASANPNYDGIVTKEMVKAAFEFADLFLEMREEQK